MAAGGDERLAYRGIFQRLFIRPEIGALIGVRRHLGLLLGRRRAIRYRQRHVQPDRQRVDARHHGGRRVDADDRRRIRPVGRCDDRRRWASSSSCSRRPAGEFGGAGLNLWIAIPLSLAVALGIGFLNGFMVENTKLPSFIITLGTYYVLIGAKLGFSKLIVDQIQVGDISEADGYDFWRKIFASEWDRTKHTWDGRDKVYVVGVMLAIALIVIAMVEMHFARRRDGTQAGRGCRSSWSVPPVSWSASSCSTSPTTSAGNLLGAAIVAVGDDRRSVRLRHVAVPTGARSGHGPVHARGHQVRGARRGRRRRIGRHRRRDEVQLPGREGRRAGLLLPVHQAGLPGDGVPGVRHRRIHDC